MGFAKELEVLFLGMEPWVMALLIIGIVFLVIEIFTAGFGFFGIAGGVMEVAAIVLRAIKGDGSPGAQVALILLFIVVICVIAFAIMALLTKLGIIKRTALISTGTAVGRDRSEGTRDYTELVGKTGVARTQLRPIGKVEIEGKIYDAVAYEYLAQGVEVKVVSVEGVKISVEVQK